MKLISSFSLVSLPGLSAQWIVNDPVNTAVNSAIQAGQIANHLEILRQWAEQLEQLNRQLRQLEDQLAVQRRIRDVMGDPTAAVTAMVLRDLGATDLARPTARRSDAMRRSPTRSIRSGGPPTESTGPRRQHRALGRELRAAGAALPPLRGGGAAGRQRRGGHGRNRTDIAAVQAETWRRPWATCATHRPRRRSTSCTPQSLRSTGSWPDSTRSGATKPTNSWPQQILNENQAAKERQDLLEKQIAEERQSVAAANAWQRALRLTPTSYTRP